MSLYDNIISLLDQYSIAYIEYDHPPILSYEDAEREKANHNWQGIESKNVFMTDGNNKYYLFVTTQGTKVDFKQMKELTGSKLALASADAVRDVIHCVPGCVAPFGFDPQITTIIDKSVFSHDHYLFSPGITTKTIQLSPWDLLPLYEKQANTTIIG
jgi:Ala-tRNA(Pro) deacylase